MTIKELRKELKLTQAQVAEIVNVSLRTYKIYENDPNKKNTIKYNYILTKLEELNYVDEEHGILKLDKIIKVVGKVLDNYDVNFCYLFGSYAKGTANEKSDIDLLVDTNTTGLQYFGLIEDLRKTLKKVVELLNIKQLCNNEVLMTEILKYGIKIYDRKKEW